MASDLLTLTSPNFTPFFRAARLGITMKAKLARLEAQEQAFLAHLQGQNPGSLSLESEMKAPKKKKKKRKEKEVAVPEEQVQVEHPSCPEQSTRKSKKKKRQQRDREESEGTTAYYEEVVAAAGSDLGEPQSREQTCRKRKKQHHSEEADERSILDKECEAACNLESHAHKDSLGRSKKKQLPAEVKDLDSEAGTAITVRKYKRKKKRQQCPEERDIVTLKGKEEEEEEMEMEMEDHRPQDVELIVHTGKNCKNKKQRQLPAEERTINGTDQKAKKKKHKKRD